MGKKRRNSDCLIYLKWLGYKIYFWSNENYEPIHVHISKGMPTPNSTKVWITKKGGCIVANNSSKIPEKELREILETISNNYFLILAKWRQHFPDKEVTYYC